MLQIDLWSETFAEKLKEAFGTRLKFLGYQERSLGYRGS